MSDMGARGVERRVKDVERGGERADQSMKWSRSIVFSARHVTASWKKESLIDVGDRGIDGRSSQPGTANIGTGGLYSKEEPQTAHLPRRETGQPFLPPSIASAELLGGPWLSLQEARRPARTSSLLEDSSFTMKLQFPEASRRAKAWCQWTASIIGCG